MKKGSKQTEEVRKKISEATTKAMANPELKKRLSEIRKGKPSWNKGKHLSEEHRKHLSEHHRTKRGFSSPMKGKHPSFETLLKMSRVMKGRFAGEKHPMYGKHQTKEAIEKNRLAHLGQPSWNKGVPMAEKSKIKLSESFKRLHLSPNTEFKKGHITWNTGEKGVYTQEQLKKMSDAQRKARSNPDIRKRMREVQLGKHHSEESKRKLSEALRGEKSYLWKGGISYEPYSLDWTRALKRLIRERDNYLCQLCKIKKGMQVHHIDYNKKNCNPDNLITLCRNCHSKTNQHRKKWLNFFKAKLIPIQMIPEIVNEVKAKEEK